VNCTQKCAEVVPFEWLSVGVRLRVMNYWTGDFIGEITSKDAFSALITVVDTLGRPFVIERDKCPFPGCSLADAHDGEHDLAAVLQVGALMEVYRDNVRFLPVATA
jgi:hypothetical protein